MQWRRVTFSRRRQARNEYEEREFFIDNLLVRILFIIVRIRWTGLAPWEFELRHHLLEEKAGEELALVRREEEVPCEGLGFRV